jgi:hypothetical protein
MTGLASAIYSGTVMHRREGAVEHRFTYASSYLLLDLDELQRLDRELAGFGVERAAPVSFRAKDHGPRDGSPLRPWFEEQARAAGVELDGGPIRLLTLPRVLGYVFNPLSVWFGFGPSGDLRLVLYEVSNTFGGWRHHVWPVRELDAAGNARHVFAKELSVSPFIGHATYEFRVRPPDERAAVLVRETQGGERILTATLVGRRRELTSATLWHAVASQSMAPFKVIAGIHLEALRLWAKGAPFRRHLPPPEPRVRIHHEEPVASAVVGTRR